MKIEITRWLNRYCRHSYQKMRVFAAFPAKGPDGTWHIPPGSPIEIEEDTVQAELLYQTAEMDPDKVYRCKITLEIEEEGRTSPPEDE